MTVSSVETAATSEVAQKAHFLAQVISRSIARIRVRRRRNKLWASSLRMLTLTGSIVVTVLLGLNVSPEEALSLKQHAFVLGAVLTLFYALEPLFNFRALWIEQEQALAELYQLQTDLDYFVAGVELQALDAKELEHFHERHSDIWNRLSTTWVQLRRAGREERGTPNSEP